MRRWVGSTSLGVGRRLLGGVGCLIVVAEGVVAVANLEVEEERLGLGLVQVVLDSKLRL